MGAEIKAIGNEILGSQVKSPVAMMLSYDSRFAFQIQPNNPRFSYPEHFHQIYRAFYQQHVSIDVIAPNSDLSSYKLIIAPAFHLVTDSIAEHLKQYVQAGGTLVVTQRTGVKDETNAVVNQRLPGLLADVCGVEVEDYDSLNSQMQNRVEFTIPELKDTSASVGVLCDIVKPTTATVVSRYTRDYYAGKPAITINQFGAGHAIYVGAVGKEHLYNTLAPWLLNLTEIQPIVSVPDGIEVTERYQDGRRLLFILNHASYEQDIVLDRHFSSLLDGTLAKGTISIAPHEVLLLQDNHH